jgi:hypothetical protein
MPITIKKLFRGSKPVQPDALIPRNPEPQPAPEPQPQPQSKPDPKSGRDLLAHLELTTSYEVYKANPGKYRMPPARACSYCGHLYIFPCDGKEPCLNAKWLDEYRAKKAS